ncbi:MAG: hypothetical protein KN64_13525 [Sulfurovum sp. AS07-7]|nr:MAG: hypothetical protein KN64_13525 [Sulfurovum sp. AS07-7]
MKTVQNIKLLNASDTTTPIQNIESGTTFRFKLKNKNRLKIAKDGEDEALRNDLLSIKNGNDLEIIYSDKTKVILEDFFSTDSSIELPAKDNGVLTISSTYDGAEGLVYAYGNRDNLLEMSDSSLHSSINQSLDFSDLSRLSQSSEIVTDGTNASSSSLSSSQVAGLSLLGIVAVGAMGSSGGGVNDTPVIETKKGYLIDSAVGGVDYYINGVYAGKTGSDGSFNYREGGKVEFKVGDLSLGILNAEDIPADGKILPQDLAGVPREDLDNPIVVAIARVLQTLDSDGDATNGITIDDNSLERLSGSGHINDLDFNALFDDGVDIVSESEAQEHLLDTTSSFFSMDKQAPTATITLSDTILKVGDTSIVKINFDETVYGFALEDLTVINGTLSNLVQDGYSSHYTALFTPNTDLESTQNVVTLSSDYKDIAGNEGTTAFSQNFVIDTKAPTTPEFSFNAHTNAISVTNLETNASWKYSLDNGDWNIISNADFVVLPSVTGSHTIKIKQMDSAGNESLIKEGSFTMVRPNDAPILTSNNGNDIIIDVDENGAYVADITATDANNDSLVYSIVGGADRDKFMLDTKDSAKAVLTFKEPSADFENPTDSDKNRSYEVIIEVNDNYGGVDRQTIVVNTKNINDNPLNWSLQNIIELSENQKTVSMVNAIDADNPTLTYSIVEGEDKNLFTIDAQTGKLEFKNAPNFENPLDKNADNTYKVDVKVETSDDESIIKNLSISVKDMIEFLPATPIMSFDDNSNYLSISNLDLAHGATWYYSLDNGTHWTQVPASTSVHIETYGNQSVLVKQVTTEGGISEVATFQVNNIAEPISLNFSDTSDTVYINGLLDGATYRYKIDSADWINGEGNSFLIAMNGTHTIEVEELLNGSVVAHETQSVEVHLNDNNQLPPQYTQGVVHQNVITLTYDESLDFQTVVPKELFSVLVNGVSVEIDRIFVNSNMAQIYLKNNVSMGDVVTFNYTDPSSLNDSNVLQDMSGVDVVSLTQVQVINTTSVSTFSVEANHIAVDEGTSNDATTTIVYNIYRGGDTTVSSSVDWSVNMGTMSVDDFTTIPPNGTLQFAPNESTKTVTFEVRRDSLYENDEIFGIQLSNPINGVFLNNSDRDSVSILNDDQEIQSQSVITEATYGDFLTSHMDSVGTLFDGEFKNAHRSNITVENGIIQDGSYMEGFEDISISDGLLKLTRDTITYNYKIVVNNDDGIVLARVFDSNTYELRDSMNHDVNTPPAIITLGKTNYTANTFDTNNIYTIYDTHESNYGDDKVKTEVVFSGHSVLSKEYDIDGVLLYETTSSLDGTNKLISGSNAYGASWSTRLVAEIIEDGQNMLILDNIDNWTQTMGSAEGAVSINEYLLAHDNYLFRENGSDLNHNGTTDDYIQVQRDNGIVSGINYQVGGNNDFPMATLINDNTLKTINSEFDYTTYAVNTLTDELLETSSQRDFKFETSFKPYDVEYFEEYALGGMDVGEYAIELKNGMDIDLSILAYDNALQKIDSLTDTQINRLVITADDVIEQGIDNHNIDGYHLTLDMGSNDILDLSGWNQQGVNGGYKLYTRYDEDDHLANLHVYTAPIVA